MIALTDLGLIEAAAAICSGRLSSEALTRACIERITARESEVAAWAWLDPDAALERARRADAEMAAGRAVGPLHGIPLGIKDIMHTRGIPTEMGSAAFAGFVPDASAAVPVPTGLESSCRVIVCSRPRKVCRLPRRLVDCVVRPRLFRIMVLGFVNRNIHSFAEGTHHVTPITTVRVARRRRSASRRKRRGRRSTSTTGDNIASPSGTIASGLCSGDMSW